MYIYILIVILSCSALTSFFFSDIFQSPMWIEFDESVPAHLNNLADSVKQSIFASKADGTVKTYLSGFNGWKRWAKLNVFHYLPANPFHVAMYLQVFCQQGSSVAPINNAIYSIDWVHGLAGYPKVSTHHMIQSMSNACKRILAKPKCRKDPITPEMLQALAEKLQDKCSISDLRTLALCLIGFAGFLRFSELCSIRSCDVCLYASHCSIFLESSKTDQLREGSWINIARTKRITCPIAALEKYLAAANIKLDDELPLFRALAPPNSSYKVRNHGISYTRAREIIKEAFKDITDVSNISLHSLRSGGASAAANAGIPDRLFKRHGRWASENAKDSYIKDNLDKLLSVSRSLGI